jgi:hypothetical protein
MEYQLNQLFVSQIQTVALVSDFSEPLNDYNNSFIISLLEFGQISNLHLMNTKEKIIVELLLQIGPFDNGVGRK